MNESSQNLIGLLPELEPCRNLFRAAAMLDAILSPEWEYRYYSYNSAWDAAEEMASMRDGEGSHYFALFTPSGLYIKGFDSERVKSGEAVLGVAEVPDDVTAFLQEPAFISDETTFCIWRLVGKEWSADKFYSAQDVQLLRLLTGGASYYSKWASDYYETELDPQAVQRIFDLEPLTPELLALFNPQLSQAQVEEDRIEIGYPRAGSQVGSDE
ncbi:hypothetical protein [Saccharibacillus sacchari]|uniref:hypothetical protein n=1 Tax=Saccharibacillus sacchari TaxID=456493 RepID=UPI00056B0FDC|nr:hypothetical protein [Saccharibacillus sacchari]